MGTTDAQALHVYVNGGSDNSLILNTNSSVQRDNSGNSRGSNAVDLQIFRTNASQVAAASRSVIGGGEDNEITTNGAHGVIAGGRNNTVNDNEAVVSGGSGNSVIAAFGTVSGGENNAIRNGSPHGVVSGGQNNLLQPGSNFSVIAGGRNNSVDDNDAVISGGWNNSVDAEFGTVSGGQNNDIQNGSIYSVIAGGRNNTINDNEAVVSGGSGNSVIAAFGTVSGGENNAIRNGSPHGVVSGGQNNLLQPGSNFSVIAGGRNNTVNDNEAVVSGGSGNSVIAAFGTVSGGENNSVQNGASYSTIGGGMGNVISGGFSAIPGGRELTLSGSQSFGFLAANSGSNPMTISASSVATFGNTDLWLANNDNAASELRFYEANSSTGAFPSGTNYTAFVAGSQSANITYTLPGAAPTADGQVMTSTTGGTMSWASELSLSNSSATVATMQLENTNASGTALEVVDGNTILAYGSGTNATIPDDVTVWVVDDNSVGASGVTAALPTGGSDGQFLYVLYNDADNGTVGGNAVANGDRLTFIHANGGWVLWHVN